MEFQRRSWIVQRIGWAIFALVILLAALGLFGDGVLSDAQAGQKEGAVWLDGTPTIIVQNGKILKDRTDWSRIEEEDILAAARESHGLERLEEIKYAVLETTGAISIIPKPGAKK